MLYNCLWRYRSREQLCSIAFLGIACMNEVIIMNNNDSVLIERKDNKGIITINRPKAMNSINWETFDKLQSAIDELIADPDVRVIILTGAGEKAFIAGGDVNEELTLEGLATYRWSQAGHKLCCSIENSAKPVIAAVNGYCLGGGFEFALACDFRICSENAKFGAPEPKLGICCGFGGDIRLPRIIGITKAKEMLMTGIMIDAQEAYRINLVNRVATQDELWQVIDDFCVNLMNKNRIVLEFIKKAVNNGSEMDLHRAIEFDSALWGVIAQTNDKREGMKAFLEKRSPTWTDS